jgi:cation diffusion facilitator CzcD-associated flavoprotein CzcO
VPSHLYSFSFAQRHDWTRVCAPQEEILTYLREVAEAEGVAGCVVPDTLVSSCSWSDEERCWTVEAADGRTFSADALVLATGQLHQPAMPRFADDDEFTGHRFHSALWDHDHDLRGRRVAVIGTGASAVQFVPIVAEQAERLYVFQRTGNWFLPRRNRPYPRPLLRLFHRFPGVQRVRRAIFYRTIETLTAMIRHPRTLGRIGAFISGTFMRTQLRDPEVRRKAWPDYTFGCKRVLFSSFFLPALQRPNVELITDGIERLAASGIVGRDGTEREVDTIIYATGFRTTQFMFPMEVTGASGVSLRDAWAEGPHAHLGIAVPGFPSLFFVYGPNTNSSGGSIVAFEEAQAGYIRQALELVSARGPIAVRPEVEAAADRELQSRFPGTAWTDCNSWYRTEDGRIVTQWPGYMDEYVRRLRTIDASDYEVVTAPEPALA